MTIGADDVVLTSCDLEPIHIPGSIQPYGIMLVATPTTGEIVGYAGTAPFLPDLLGTKITAIVGHDLASITEALPRSGIHILSDVELGGAIRDAIVYASGGYLVFEFTEKVEGASIDVTFVGQLEGLEARLERAATLEDLSNEASRIFQRLTGYSRVMVYRFIDDDAGVVLGESIADDSPSFMRHHFPASDIPRQARALYVRNRVRVIADVHYAPAPIVSASSNLRELDLSDSTLRSVSPVHIQYLKNMGVAASASMSIVKDGVLWGLIACHHHSPRPLPLATRIACQAMATSLARLIKGREETELYRERIRLRAREDSVLARLGEDNSLNDFFARSGKELAEMLRADGFAAVQGADLFCSGNCPDPAGVRAIAEHVRVSALMRPVATRNLAREFPAAEAWRDTASGLLAVTMSTEVPTILMWFRAEQLQTVKWAGNPHKDVPLEPGAVLTPRASFEAWSESVSGRSDEWSLAEKESSARIVRLMLESRNNARIRLLNREMSTTLRENEGLISQKDFLLREVNHRVQNSLALVAAFLRMQARNAEAEARVALEEAEKRLVAVSLAHRRLYQDDSVEIIDLSRYLDELVRELLASMDRRWGDQLRLDVAPVLVSTDRAVTVGLVVNELLTNVTKYAYDGQPGPTTVRVEQHRNMLRIIVSDSGRGRGNETTGTGFGTRMIAALVQRLNGTLDYTDNVPGTRVVITAPLDAPDPAPGH
jgi:light-regulated signal transduction histidine kinase (bacteriophytochrome)